MTAKDGAEDFVILDQEKVDQVDKKLPGPNDWGYKYEPRHQRDPYNSSKPLAR
jgi:hypothetical protein